MTADMAGPQHWDARDLAVARRLPSRLFVTVNDLIRLLARHIRLGNTVLEVGCAPGKFLLWCALAGQARVSGVEYAPRSAEVTGQLI
jgi:2-polyprenyl-3-methyl-5-hydroxy-6-metoxy-1,4-benzoquinol methylase